MARYHVRARPQPRAELTPLGVLTIADGGRLSLDPADRAARLAGQEVLDEIAGSPGIDVATEPYPDDPPGARRMRRVRPGEPGYEAALVEYLERVFGWAVSPIDGPRESGS